MDSVLGDTVISPDQLARLWHAHSAKLLLIARAIGEPAEDAVQEAFIRLGQQEQLPQQPMAWLVRVARNQILGWHRTGQRQSLREQQYALQLSWFQNSKPDEHLEAQELAAALQRLPAIERQIVVMHIWGELTFEQIAVEFALSRATAHRRFQDAVAQLRCQFDGASASAADHRHTKSQVRLKGSDHESTS